MIRQRGGVNGKGDHPACNVKGAGDVEKQQQEEVMVVGKEDLGVQWW